MRAFKADSIPCPPLTDAVQKLWRHRPFDIEIGAGQGLHAIQYCEKNPARTLLAIERTRNKFSAFHQRLSHHPHIQNLFPLRADAVAVVSHWLPDMSVDRVFLLYPNPYPKPKQANLRWHRSPFIHCLHRKLAPGGTLHLATNLEWYAAEASEWLEKQQIFQTQTYRRLANAQVPRTHFEKKYLERGETCFDLVFEKRVQ